MTVSVSRRAVLLTEVSHKKTAHKKTRPGQSTDGFSLLVGKAGYFFEGRILQTVVPQVGHLPFRMGRPFFMVSSLASTIFLFALHFTQYASDICSCLLGTSLTTRCTMHLILS